MDYKDLLKKLVCSTDNRECMLHLCTACPGKEEFNKVLTELFEDDNYELDDTVRYKQWVHTDRTTLITVENEVHEFIDVAANYKKTSLHYEGPINLPEGFKREPAIQCCHCSFGFC